MTDRRPDYKHKRLSLTSQILLGLLLGLAWGLFFGESGAWAHWIGDAYVGLLQMTVLPFVALSLIANIGRLSASQSGRLARISVRTMLLLWGIGLLVLLAMSAAFPEWEAGSFFSSSLVQEPEAPNWLELFIPSNPFWSLTHNLVPAVVLFSLGLGVALMAVPNKELLLDKLDIAVEGLTRLNKMVVRLSPLGIFGIVADASGTLSWKQFELLQGYLLVYGAAALLLSLWILPALIASCTPFTHRSVLNVSRDTLLTAFVIGNTFVVLPLIVDAVKRLTEIRSHETDHTPEYFVPLAYPFPDIGRIVGLVFIPFAAWFYGMQIAPDGYVQMIGVGFLGAFAKPVVTMPLLLNVAEIPSDIFNLYLSVGVFAARFGDLMKAMHLMAFSTMTAAALAGAFRVRWRRLLISGGSTLLLVALTVVAIRGFLDVTFADAYSKKQLVTAAQLLLPSAPSEVTQYAAVNPTPFQPHEDSMQRILRRGCIRVGFRPDELPFSYFNQDGELVGLDIDMAHQLARDLGVRIEFVPCPSDEIDALHRDYFDIAMSGYNGTVRRATELPHTSSYMEVTVALVVPDHRTREFRTGARLPDRADVRIAVVQDSAASELSIRLPASVEVVEIPTERVFFETQPPPADALATSAEAGSAWTLQYPQFKVVRPAGFRASIPLYYLVARESQFEEFLEGWLALKRRDGTIDQLYDYWILGKSTTDQPPRWCILRDLLHWID